MTDLSPDLRELTTYCRHLQLTKYKNFLAAEAPPEGAQQKPETLQAEEAAALASYTDRTLAHAISQIADFKEVEASLATQKDSSLRSMSKILSSLAQKALDRSRSTGDYVHLTHIFYKDFSPSSVVSRSTFYGYKAAVTRYALKRVADLLPHLPSNVDNREIIFGFQKMTTRQIPDQDQEQTPYPTNVDNEVDTQIPNVDNREPHRLTAFLLDFENYEIVEPDPKLSVYPWFAKRRHRTRDGISPMLTKAEMVELAECIRFICHFPPDLKFERRGIAGQKRTREFILDEAFTDGLLLNAPKPRFSSPKTSKRSFDRSDDETKKAISRENKRLASTAFNPSAFWLDVEARVKDHSLKEVIATQLITGCRPAEVVSGVIVSTEPTDEPESLGRLHFTIFGAKTKTSATKQTKSSRQIDNYKDFLEKSSIATNSKIRGQFYHTETIEVYPQFPERVWLYYLLFDRYPDQIDDDRNNVIALLLEKVCHFRKMPKTTSIAPEVLEFSPSDERRVKQKIAARTGKNVITDEDIAEEVRRLNNDAHLDHLLINGQSSSRTEDFENFIMTEIRKIHEAKTKGKIRIVSPYQTSRIVRFRFLPQLKSFPMMANFDGIPFLPTNVDNVLDMQAAELDRIFLRNEFSQTDLDLMNVPEEHRLLIDPRDYARLQSERAAYVESAVIQLGKRYKTAASGGAIEPTPYVARHRLISDLKGLKDDAGRPALSREDIARKAGHASTASQTGYGKAAFADKGAKNRGKSLKGIKSSQNVKDPKITAGRRLYVPNQPGFKPQEPRYEPKE